jgi:hypothetical protein
MKGRMPRDILKGGHKKQKNKKSPTLNQNRSYDQKEFELTVPHVDISSISKIGSELVTSEIFQPEYFHFKSFKRTYFKEPLKEFYLNPESLYQYYNDRLKPALTYLNQDTKLSIGRARELVIKLITDNLDMKGREYFKEFCMERINKNFPKDRDDEIIELKLITETDILDEIVKGIANDEKERKGYTPEQYNKLILIRSGWTENYFTRISERVYGKNLMGLENITANLIEEIGEKTKASLIRFNNLLTKKSTYNEEDSEKYGHKKYISKEEAWNKTHSSYLLLVALTAFAIYELYEKHKINIETQSLESQEEKLNLYAFVAMYIENESHRIQEKIVKKENKINNYTLALDLLAAYQNDWSAYAFLYGISGMKNISEWDDEVIQIAKKTLERSDNNIAKATRMLHSKIIDVKKNKQHQEEELAKILELTNNYEAIMNKLSEKNEEKEYTSVSEEGSDFKPKV